MSTTNEEIPEWAKKLIEKVEALENHLKEEKPKSRFSELRKELDAQKQWSKKVEEGNNGKI